MPLGPGVRYVDTDMAYLAGFFDGEGSIMLIPSTSVNRGPGRYRLTLAVSNTVEHSVVRYAITFGGSVLPIAAKNARCKSSYRWMITSAGAERALMAMLPFLKVKKDQAQVALDFRSTQQRPLRGQKLSAEEVSHRDQLVTKLRDLNSKGPRRVA